MNHNRATMAAVGRCFLALISICVLESTLSAAPMVYTGLVVTDVRVGTTLMHNASVKMTFEGDSNNIVQVPVPSEECGGNGYFFLPDARRRSHGDWIWRAYPESKTARRPGLRGG